MADSDCPSCKPGSRTNMLLVAVAVVLLLVLIYYITRACSSKKGERFVSERAREVYTTAKTVFDRTSGAATYTTYKTEVPQADPVLYTDTRRLWQENKLTPEAVQRVA